MAGLAERRAARQRVLKMIYDETEGSRLNYVSGQWLLDKSGIPDSELGEICEYLESEHMIKCLKTLWGHYTPYQISMGHLGIKEMERLSDSEPPTPTPNLDLQLVREALRLWESAGEAIELPADDAAQLAAEMRTVKAQVESPRPNHKSIREHLETARQILIAAAGGVAATELVNLIAFVLQHH